VLIVTCVLCVAGVPSPRAQAEGLRDSSLTVPLSATGVSVFASSPFDTIDAEEYAAPRSYSLDHFMESMSAYLVGRAGPIGAQASFSRYGMGRGRGLVYLGGVLLNDPQDDRVPLALTQTTSIGEIVVGDTPGSGVTGNYNIEGIVRIIEPTELERDPMAAINLSKGDHQLKQRRARYSSPRKPAGVDFGYDELRNNGYNFDATGNITLEGLGFGSSATRASNFDIRGVVHTEEKYRFSLRQFQTTFQGDTLDPFSDNRRDGFIALVQASTKNFALDLYGRNYKVSTRDSVTMNETTSLAVAVPVSSEGGRRVVFGLGYENINSKQDIANGSTSNRLRKASASLSAGSPVGSGTVVQVGADVSTQFDYAWGWGARVAARRQLSRTHQVTVVGRRGYRLPNLSELFLPLHRLGNSAPGDTNNVAGNQNLKSESSLEAALRWYADLGTVRNELRFSALRVRDPILSVEVEAVPHSLAMPLNADAQGLQVIEDRLRIVSTRWGFEFNVDGGVMVALGDRNGYFQGVPNVRGIVGASFGRSLFKDTSHIQFGAEYLYSGSRVAGGAELSAYDVLNLKLEGRLVDAYLYVLWLNVFDEQYATIWPYLMTPRTFVYGIQWTLYN
jgi:hypothetical protein